MIASLTGILQHKEPGLLILDVHGVGYEVAISSRTYDRLPGPDEELFLQIHTSVREDAIVLYGFATAEEKELFVLLNSVSGIGPKLALSILSGLSVADFCQAVASRDLARLTSLSGVGKKTAQRLCMELGEKLGGLMDEPNLSDMPAGTVAAVVEGDVLQDAVSALVNLGYGQDAAWRSVRAIQKQDAEKAATMPAEEMIRLALQAM
jgi:Holliday junction DNA helicase RuvA